MYYEAIKAAKLKIVTNHLENSASKARLSKALAIIEEKSS
jgi:hypothetical protein